MQLPRERVPYSAIVDRPKLNLPDDGRLVVWTIVNVEEWQIERAMPRTVLPPPMGQPLLPDLPNWAWHEYGMRVGFWRLLEVLRHFGVTPTFAINGNVCNSYPRIAEAALAASWEFMGHGFVQGPMHKLDDQRGAIRDTIATIRRFTGTAPRGWESPGLTETYETPDLLREEGIEYVADWVLDDQPVAIATRAGPLVSIPYTLETNDITVHALQQLPRMRSTAAASTSSSACTRRAPRSPGSWRSACTPTSPAWRIGSGIWRSCMPTCWRARAC